MNNLQRQLKSPDHKKDAEDCIKIYNWIKETDPEGRVWNSRWSPLVSIRWEGPHPTAQAISKPTIMGYTVLKGIDS